MTVYCGRPLAAALTAWLIAGILLINVGERIPSRAFILAVALFAAASVIALMISFKSTGQASKTLVLVFFALFASVIRYGAFFGSQTLKLPKEGYYNGTVGEISGSTVIVDCGRMKTSFESFSDLTEGDMITFYASPFEGAGVFETDLTAYLRSRGVFTRCEASEIEIVGDAGPSLFSDVRTRIKTALRQLSHADFARAILLGDRSLLPGGMKKSLSSIGASHVTAVSGLHVSVLIFLFVSMAKKLGFSPATRAATAIVPAVFFVLLLDFTPSVTRAAVMTSLYFLARSARRDSDGLTNLFCAVFIILLIDPCAAADGGFLMSFSATLGIIRVSVPLKKLVDKRFKKRFKSRIRDFFSLLTNAVLTSAALSFGAVLFSLPVSALFGAFFNPFCVITNVVLLVLFTPTLVLVFLFVPLYLLFSSSASVNVFGGVCDFLLWLFEYSATEAAKIFPSVTLRTPLTQWVITGVLIGAVIALAVIKHPPAASLAGAASLAALCAAVNLIGAFICDAEVIRVYSKQSAGTLILRSREQTVLVTNESRLPTELYKVCEKLGIEHFDVAAVLSDDAAYTADTLSDSFGIGALIIPDRQNQTLPFAYTALKESSVYGGKGGFELIYTLDGGFAADIIINGKRISVRSGEASRFPAFLGQPDLIISPETGFENAVRKTSYYRSFYAVMLKGGVAVLQGSEAPESS